MRCPPLAECCHELLRLGARHLGIVLPLQDEQRRADLRDMRERRALAVELRVLLWVAELAEHQVANVAARGRGHRRPGDHADDRHAGRESIRMKGERHQREIPAIARAVRADARRIGQLLITEPRGAARDVLEVLAAPVAPVRFTPLSPVAGRSARVRCEHDKSGVHEHLRGDVPLAVVLVGRPAVDVDDRGRDLLASEGLFVRKEEERRHVIAVRAGIADVRRLHQRLRIDRCRQRPRDPARLDGALAREIDVGRP